MSPITPKHIYALVREAKRVLLVPHQNPDGDALGSSTAFAEWLHTIGVTHDIFCNTKVERLFPYLSHVAEIQSASSLWNNHYDVVVVFDSGDLAYAGIEQYLSTYSGHRPVIINIDHHMTNKQYGTYNYVDIQASSTCEIIFRFFKANNIQINQRMATSLLTGIITDTDNFTNSATNATVIDIAGRLTNLGANFDMIKAYVYKNISIDAFGLWGKMLSRLAHHPQLNVVHTYVTNQDVTDLGLQADDASGMTNFLNMIEEGHACLIFKETAEGHTKGSFRTTRGDVDVAQMAKHFGGGGHKKAAGFTIEKPIHEAIAYVMAELEQLFPFGILQPIET